MKENKILDKSIILLFIITCIVVFFGYTTITPSEKISCVLIAIMAIFVFMLQGKKSIKLEKNTKILLIFDLFCTLSLTYTISFGLTSYQLTIIWLLTIFKIVIDNNSFNSNLLNKIINIIAFFGFIHVFFTLLYFIFPSLVQSINKKILSPSGYKYNLDLYRYGCIAGITSDHGTDAIFISMFLSAVSVKTIRNFNLKNIILFLLGFLALMLTGKRGQLIASALAFIVTFITINKGDKKKIKSILIGTTTIALAVTIISYIPEAQFVFERFKDAKTATDLLNGRGDSYAIMINNFSKHFLIGSGFRSTLVINSLNDGHNIYLQLLSEGGIIGFTIMISFLIKNLIQAFKLRESYYKYFAISFQIFFLVYGMSGNPLYFVPPLIIYLFCTLDFNPEKEEKK